MVEGCLLWEGPHAGAGAECEERQKQRVMDWPQPPFPVPLHRWRGGGRENGE